jgi:hypothetical protein
VASAARRREEELIAGLFLDQDVRALLAPRPAEEDAHRPHVPIAELAARPPSFLARSAGYPPEDWQEEALDSKAPRVVITAARQTGKTTVFSVGPLHRLLQPRKLIVVVAPILVQAEEIHERIRELLTNLGLWHVLVDPKDHKKRSTRAKNGSRIVIRSGHKPANIRGLSSVDSVWLDEAAFAHDALVPSLLPMLARSGGIIRMGSSAFGARGYFWQVATNQERRGAGWVPINVTGPDSAALSNMTADDGRPYLEVARETMGEFWYEQEFMNVFHQPQGALFLAEHVDLARSLDVHPLWDDPTWTRLSAQLGVGDGNASSDGSGLPPQSTGGTTTLW